MLEGASWSLVTSKYPMAARWPDSGEIRRKTMTRIFQRYLFLHSLTSFIHCIVVLLHFFFLQPQEEEVLGRIKASLDEPLALEAAGFALFDLYPQRRGNLFSDEVYRLTKATDATTTYPRSMEADDDDNESNSAASAKNIRYLPPNHKFTNNDVIMLTLQPNGSGDFFGPNTLPTHEHAVSVEARVLNHGPTYLDIAMPAGTFETGFGMPAPNDASFGSGKSSSSSFAMRLRADRFLSNVPYQRMVAALAQTTSIPDRQKRSASPEEVANGVSSSSSAHDSIRMFMGG